MGLPKVNVWTVDFFKNPDSNIIQQRLADQRIFITRSKILKDAELEEIRKKYESGRPNSNGRVVEETQITIGNIEEAAIRNYRNDNLEF